MSKGNPDKVNPVLAKMALRMANGDRKSAYGKCVQLSWQTTGRMAPGFDNKDLQAFYDRECLKDE